MLGVTNARPVFRFGIVSERAKGVDLIAPPRTWSVWSVAETGSSCAAQDFQGVPVRARNPSGISQVGLEAVIVQISLPRHNVHHNVALLK